MLRKANEIIISTLLFVNGNLLVAYLLILIFITRVSSSKLSVNLFDLLLISILPLILFSHIALSVFNEGKLDIISLLSESKLYLFALIFIFASPGNGSINLNVFSKNGDRLIDHFILLSFLILFLSIILHGTVIRSIDFFDYYIGINSIYYGIMLAYLACICSYKRLPYLIFLGILNASGTGLIGLSIALVSRLWRKINITYMIILLMIVAYFFYIGQLQHRRDIFNPSSIDRVIIAQGYLNYLYDYASLKLIMIGNGPFISLQPMLNYFENTDVVVYIAKESQHLTSRLLHNDFLRIFNSYGMVGLIIFLYFIKRKVIKDSTTFIVLCTMNLASSVWYVSSVMILIFIMNNLNHQRH